MTEVNNISVKKSTHRYAYKSFTDPTANKEYVAAFDAFQAGAQWQKEQYKYLMAYMATVADMLEVSGATTTSQDIREAIEKYNP